ncbi:hypothetical protein GGI20_003888 [Coemansia sp. BCRC 34301]|nr:hypothetical protein GGI20_003888 [Coemansia sp. BCRC 34301]
MASTSVIAADTVRIAIDQMFGILDGLQKKVEPRRDASAMTITTTTHNARSHREMPRLVLQTSKPTVDIYQYRAKCSELEELACKLRTKCLEYDRLSNRYNQLQTRLQQQQQKKNGSVGAMAHKQGASSLTGRDPFLELNALEQTTMGVPAGYGAKRTSPSAQVSPDNAHTGSAAEGTTPTKRPRRGTLNSGLPALLSSPLTTHKPLLSYNPRRRGNVSTTSGRSALKAPVSSPPFTGKSNKVSGAAPSAPAALPRVPPTSLAIFSSQETRMDFSDPPFIPDEEGDLLCLGTHPEEGKSEYKGENAADGDVWPFVLQTSIKPEQYQEWPSDTSSGEKGDGDVCAQRSPDLQRILDAVGDCESCRSFYSVPGVVLPTRDPSTICQHARSGSRKNKGKAAATDWGAMRADGAVVDDGPSTPQLGHRSGIMSAPRPMRGPTASSHPTMAPRQPPNSEQRRPTTPDHFWDIDYFPPIKTLGTETFRGDKHRSLDPSRRAAS